MYRNRKKVNEAFEKRTCIFQEPLDFGLRALGAIVVIREIAL